MTPEQGKQASAERALEYVQDNSIVGVGTGSTVAYFIQGLGRIKHRIEPCAQIGNDVVVVERDPVPGVIRSCRPADHHRIGHEPLQSRRRFKDPLKCR